MGHGELSFNRYRVSVSQDEKCSGDGWWWWLHNTGNVFNQLTVRVKIVKTVRYILLCVFYHTNKKKTGKTKHWIFRRVLVRENVRNPSQGRKHCSEHLLGTWCFARLPGIHCSITCLTHCWGDRLREGEWLRLGHRATDTLPGRALAPAQRTGDSRLVLSAVPMLQTLARGSSLWCEWTCWCQQQFAGAITEIMDICTELCHLQSRDQTWPWPWLRVASRMGVTPRDSVRRWKPWVCHC